MSATLDAIDAHDLDLALGKAAHNLLAAGSTEPLDVRRAQALGEIARHELALDFTTGECLDPDLETGRDATLYVDLPADALDAFEHTTTATSTEPVVATVEKTGAARDYPLGLDRLREWLTRPGTTISIRPVLDLAAPIECRGYQPSPRLREQIILRNRTCVFPFCTRAKTHGHWSYTPLAPGEFLWRGPHRQAFLVDPTGTTDLRREPTPREQPPEQPPGRHPHRP